MTISTLAMLGLAGSGLLYIYLAVRGHRRTKTLGDHLPIVPGTHAAVLSSREFSAATVATTISLATVILAYTELASFFGLWLLWTVLTTALGLFVARLAAPIIWQRLNEHGKYRPTLHEFLGASFESNSLARAAALCTSLGFLGALAVELSVGSRFLVGLAPNIPPWIGVLVLASIGVIYTSLGGFRIVIVTDRIQMWAIWGCIAALLVMVWIQANSMTGGMTSLLAKMPRSMYDFSWREGLGAFLIGVTILNVPTYLSDMSIWQRIAGTQNKDAVAGGLTRSAISAFVSWSALALLACLISAMVATQEGQNPLTSFLLSTFIGGPVWSVLFLVVIVGLYGASLSTASTQLIAAGHTIHTDLIRASANRISMSGSKEEMLFSRVLLICAATISVLIVEGLRLIGFSIADLVFAVFGAQLSLVPATLAGLFLPKRRLHRATQWSIVGVLGGFVVGWLAASYGKLSNNADLVFLSPVLSLVWSSFFIGLGILLGRR